MADPQSAAEGDGDPISGSAAEPGRGATAAARSKNESNGSRGDSAAAGAGHEDHGNGDPRGNRAKYDGPRDIDRGAFDTGSIGESGSAARSCVSDGAGGTANLDFDRAAADVDPVESG